VIIEERENIHEEKKKVYGHKDGNIHEKINNRI
jgi:hypothetical protein